MSQGIHVAGHVNDIDDVSVVIASDYDAVTIGSFRLSLPQVLQLRGLLEAAEGRAWHNRKMLAVEDRSSPGITTELATGAHRCSGCSIMISAGSTFVAITNALENAYDRFHAVCYTKLNPTPFECANCGEVWRAYSATGAGTPICPACHE